MASKTPGGGCKKKKRSDTKKAAQAMRVARNKDRRAKARMKKAKQRAWYIAPSQKRNEQFKVEAASRGLTLKEYRTLLNKEKETNS